jgi:hypothetical protein
MLAYKSLVKLRQAGKHYKMELRPPPFEWFNLSQEWVSRILTAYDSVVKPFNGL